MNVKWLIEEHKDLDNKDLIPELKKQGIEYKTVKYIPFEGGNYNVFPEKDCVIVYSTLNLAKQIQRNKQWIPGVYCNFNNFKCSTYYSHWGGFLLNQDYTMMPLLDFVRHKDAVYDRFGVDDCVFMRPNSGAKTFNGAVFPKEEIDKEIDTIKCYAGKDLDQILVIISTPKKIDCEWRVVVASRKVIALSQYKKDGKLDLGDDGHHGYFAMTQAQEIAKHKWQPDRVYTLDICLNNGVHSLLEANSFSCSGLYRCNYKAIVQMVSLEAIREWNEYNQ